MTAASVGYAWARPTGSVMAPLDRDDALMLQREYGGTALVLLSVADGEALIALAQARQPRPPQEAPAAWGIGL